MALPADRPISQADVLHTLSQPLREAIWTQVQPYYAAAVEQCNLAALDDVLSVESEAVATGMLALGFLLGRHAADLLDWLDRPECLLSRPELRATVVRTGVRARDLAARHGLAAGRGEREGDPCSVQVAECEPVPA